MVVLLLQVIVSCAYASLVPAKDQWRFVTTLRRFHIVCLVSVLVECGSVCACEEDKWECTVQCTTLGSLHTTWHFLLVSSMTGACNRCALQQGTRQVLNSLAAVRCDPSPNTIVSIGIQDMATDLGGMNISRCIRSAYYVDPAPCSMSECPNLTQ
jgi:hypothetical protein